MTGLYYIAVDENGCPYIAHSEEPRQHKYILKIRVNGRDRYFYTKAEIDAYYRQQRARNGPSMKSGSSRSQQLNEETKHGPSSHSMSSKIQPQYEKSMFGDKNARLRLRSAEKELKEAKNIKVPERTGEMQKLRDIEQWRNDEELRRKKERQIMAAQEKVDRAKADLNESRMIDDVPRNLYYTGKKVITDRLWRR